MDKQEASHWLKGAEHAEQGRMQEAEEAFAAAVLQDPGLHMARFQLGLLQWSTGRAGAALVTWQPLSEMAAGVDVFHFTRAFGLLCASDLQGALSEFRRGIACCTNEPLARDMQRIHEALTLQLEALTPERPAHHVLLANYVSAGQPH
jgi:hypothetical protein